MRIKIGEAMQKWGKMDDVVYLNIDKDTIAKIYNSTNGTVYFDSDGDICWLAYREEYELRDFVQRLLTKKVLDAIEKEEITEISCRITEEDIAAIKQKRAEIMEHTRKVKREEEERRRINAELSSLLKEKKFILKDNREGLYRYVLVDGTELKTRTIEDKKKSIEYLSNLKDEQVLRNALDQRDKKIQELRDRQQELEVQG